MLHDNGHKAVPQVVEGKYGFGAALGALIFGSHEIASQFYDMRKVFVDELLGKAELVGACQNRLTIFVEHRIRTEKETIATYNCLVIRIPDNQLFIGFLHLVIFVKIHGIARRTTGFSKSQLTQPAYLRDNIGGILPGDNVKFVMSFVCVFQFLGFGEFRFEQLNGYGVNYCIHNDGDFQSILDGHGLETIPAMSSIAL